MNPTAKGDVSEQAIVLALMRAGKTVLKPLSSGLRYDLVIDNLDGTFTRVQCKTGVLKGGGGAVHFRAYSMDGRRPRPMPYQGQVDCFGVYCPQNGEVYIVPIAALGAVSTVATLRLLPPAAASSRASGTPPAFGFGQAHPPRSGGRDSNLRPLPWRRVESGETIRDASTIDVSLSAAPLRSRGEDSPVEGIIVVLERRHHAQIDSHAAASLAEARRGLGYSTCP